MGHFVRKADAHQQEYAHLAHPLIVLSSFGSKQALQGRLGRARHIVYLDVLYASAVYDRLWCLTL